MAFRHVLYQVYNSFKQQQEKKEQTPRNIPVMKKYSRNLAENISSKDQRQSVLPFLLLSQGVFLQENISIHPSLCCLGRQQMQTYMESKGKGWGRGREQGWPWGCALEEQGEHWPVLARPHLQRSHPALLGSPDIIHNVIPDHDGLSGQWNTGKVHFCHLSPSPDITNSLIWGLMLPLDKLNTIILSPYWLKVILPWGKFMPELLQHWTGTAHTCTVCNQSQKSKGFGAQLKENGEFYEVRPLLFLTIHSCCTPSSLN